MLAYAIIDLNVGFYSVHLDNYHLWSKPLARESQLAQRFWWKWWPGQSTFGENRRRDRWKSNIGAGPTGLRPGRRYAVIAKNA